MATIKLINPALILVDFQKGFDDITYWGKERNNPNAEENAKALLAYWRERDWPVFHIQHRSLNPDSRLAEGQPGHEIKEAVRPLLHEKVIQKNVNSAFIGTNLKDELDKQNITQVVITGLTTDQCVSTTTRMAGNYGYETYIVHDATATFSKKGFTGQEFSADLIHETALASLHNEFAGVLSTMDIIDQL